MGEIGQARYAKWYGKRLHFRTKFKFSASTEKREILPVYFRNALFAKKGRPKGGVWVLWAIWEMAVQ
jgi:hypothetical protein